MFGSNVLDISIGVTTYFILLSLLASTVSELIDALFKNRANCLSKAVSKLVPDVTKFYSDPWIKGLYTGGKKPSYIPAETFTLALASVFDSAKTDNLPAGIIAAIMAIKAKIEVSHLGQDLAAEQKVVASWFNNAMDRASGDYKRWSQYILLIVGVTLAVLLNADLIQMVNGLNRDSGLRDCVVSASQSIAKLGGSSPQGSVEQIETYVDKMHTLNFPIGWHVKFDQTKNTQPDKKNELDLDCPDSLLSNSGEVLRRHLLGWLLTGLGVSLGAPFWFDLLDRFMSVRSTGEKPGVSSSKIG